jgi:FKBP-type peptidyl-prolyl cis-trans isomerase
VRTKKPWIAAHSPLADVAGVACALALAFPLLAGCQAKKADDSAKTASSAAAAPSSASSADSIPALNMNQPPNRPEPIPPPSDVAAAPADAQKTASGLVTKVLAKGTGTAHPAPSDRVKVNYTGWTTDGKMFDSSIPRSEPATFGVGEVIPGWTEGLQLMVTGEKRRMWIPANLAYGPRGMPGIPANSPLTFDVELLDITQTPKPPPVPADVAAPPASATKTASGLAYKMLSAGKDVNAPKPGPTSTVLVNYTGWTTDGKMFDSSIPRGKPQPIPVNRVIKGWTEGLQLMKVGDKMRFWIPAKLAYDDPDHPKRPGAPQGMLVFDVELLNVMQGGPSGMPQMHPQQQQTPEQQELEQQRQQLQGQH